MRNVPTVELTRDCQAVQIPHGSTVTLPKGTTVDITQTLGGTYTVHATGGLFRIARTHADALRVQHETGAASRPASNRPVTVGDRQSCDLLRGDLEPEVPANIDD